MSKYQELLEEFSRSYMIPILDHKRDQIKEAIKQLQSGTEKEKLIKQFLHRVPEAERHGVEQELRGA